MEKSGEVGVEHERHSTQLTAGDRDGTTLRGDEEDDEGVEHKRGTLTIVAWEVTTTHLFLRDQIISLTCCCFPFSAAMK